MERIQRHPSNEIGRDLAVGDIHGHFDRLQAALDAAGFDPARDRLFSVGDLVDRGPQSEQVLHWLDRPWFHAVCGNHDDYAVRIARGNPVDRDNYRRNGGGWFLALPAPRQQEIGAALARLPIAMEVETDNGVVGIVHADCPFPDWQSLRKVLQDPPSRRVLAQAEDECMWSRARLERDDLEDVAGVRAVVVGHTPLAHPVALGNVYHIDTAGWLPQGRFTLLDLATLHDAHGQAIPALTAPAP
ncbi:metallophosphoesterase [Geminicoccus roseus]|uniref:metallophosphoesterase n=1 Tax=Geminicoccus roseus TaxID=404900 RepID=UPI0003FCBD9E|nr:metallophosphoesterase [Geminicoccus roseus]